MQYRTKATNPSEKEIEKLVKQIKDVKKEIQAYIVDLSLSERRRLLKPRPGSDKVTQVVTRVAGERNVQVAGIPAADIEANLVRAQRLAPLRQEVAAFAQSLRDSVFEAESMTWWATTALYTMLQAATRNDAALRTALAPATAFFATGRRKAKVAAAK